MFCSKCGQIIETGSEFCIGCGSHLKTDEIGGKKIGKIFSFTKKIFRKKIVLGLVIALFILIVGMYFGFIPARYLPFISSYIPVFNENLSTFQGNEEFINSSGTWDPNGTLTYNFKPVETQTVKSTRQVEIKFGTESGKIVSYKTVLQIEPKGLAKDKTMIVEENIPKKLVDNVGKIKLEPPYPYIKDADPHLVWDFSGDGDPFIKWWFDDPEGIDITDEEITKNTPKSQIKIEDWEEALTERFRNYLQGWENGSVWQVRSVTCPGYWGERDEYIPNPEKYAKIGDYYLTIDILYQLMDTFIYQYGDVKIYEVKKESDNKRAFIRAIAPATMIAKSTGEKRTSEMYPSENKEGTYYWFEKEKDYGWCFKEHTGEQTLGPGQAEEYEPVIPEWLFKPPQEQQQGGTTHKFKSPSGIEWEVDW